jgi:prolyl-tRNA synthetase
VPLAEFAAGVPALLAEIQQGLFDRARAFRDERTVRLESAAAVADFFGTGDGGGRGGFAHVHVADDPAVAAAFDPLKVTVRCIPMDGPDEPGTCVVTGRPVSRRSVLARAY